MKNSQIPKRPELFEPTIQALKNLNGSGSISEINDEVFRLMKIPDKVIAIRRKSNEKRAYNESALEYELAWVRTILKKKGILEKSARGIWALKDFSENDNEPLSKSIKIGNENLTDDITPDEEYGWKSEVRKILTEDISPAEFERLIQRILRESGFVQVEVTGRSGDGGIDGRGIARINGILSFHILFQCKR